MFFILIFKLCFFMYIIMYDNNKPNIFYTYRVRMQVPRQNKLDCFAVNSFVFFFLIIILRLLDNIVLD